MDALDRPPLQQLGVRRGDRGAADHARVSRDRRRSAASFCRNRGRRHRRSPVRDLARRLLPWIDDLHRQMVRRPARRRGLVSGARAWAPGRLSRRRRAHRRDHADRRLRMGAGPGEPFGVADDGRVRRRRHLSPRSLARWAVSAKSHRGLCAIGFRRNGMRVDRIGPYFDRRLAPRIADLRTQERSP